ncbi:MAG TPA: hypothetical protein VMZ11_07190 [Mycobacteriales bacterium]|nr:hypothetical protein [Mycobacteriales bacterium]
MRVRVLLGVAALAAVGVVPLTATAAPVPPACVVVDQDPVHLQVGYAPNGPADCTTLP